VTGFILKLVTGYLTALTRSKPSFE